MMVSVHHGWILLWISNTAWWRLLEDCLKGDEKEHSFVGTIRRDQVQLTTGKGDRFTKDVKERTQDTEMNIKRREDISMV